MTSARNSTESSLFPSFLISDDVAAPTAATRVARQRDASARQRDASAISWDVLRAHLRSQHELTMSLQREVQDLRSKLANQETQLAAARSAPAPVAAKRGRKRRTPPAPDTASSEAIAAASVPLQSHQPSLLPDGPMQIYQVLAFVPNAPSAGSAPTTNSAPAELLPLLGEPESIQEVAESLINLSAPTHESALYRSPIRSISAAHLSVSSARVDASSSEEPHTSSDSLEEPEEPEEPHTPPAGTTRSYSVAFKHRLITMGKDASTLAQQFGIKRKTIENWLGRGRAAILAEYDRLTNSGREHRKNVAYRRTLDDRILSAMARYVASSSDKEKVTKRYMKVMCRKFRSLLLPFLTPVADPRVQNMVRSLNALKFSSQWCRNTLFQHTLLYSNLKGEAGSVDSASVEAARAALRQLLLNWSPDLIYNADESALFWMQDIGKEVHRPTVNRGKKKSKKRVSILFAVNASGSHMIKPLIINQSLNPRCLKDIKLDVEWEANASAWMTAEIFSDWLRAFDREMGRVHPGQRVVLLMDGVSMHHVIFEIKLKNVTCILLPPNMTCHLQPLDQGIIFSFKCSYHKAASTTKAEARITIINDQAVARALKRQSSSLNASQPPSNASIPDAASVSTSPLPLQDISSNVDSSSSSSSSNSSPTQANKRQRVNKTAKEPDTFTLNEMQRIVSNAWMHLKPAVVQNCWKKAGLLSDQHLSQLAESNRERGIVAEAEDMEAFDEADFELESLQEDAAISVHERRQESVMDVAYLVDSFLPHDD